MAIYMAMYGHIYGHMVIYGHIWPYMAIYGPYMVHIWPYIRPYMDIYGHIYGPYPPPFNKKPRDKKPESERHAAIFFS